MEPKSTVSFDRTGVCFVRFQGDLRSTEGGKLFTASLISAFEQIMDQGPRKMVINFQSASLGPDIMGKLKQTLSYASDKNIKVKLCYTGAVMDCCLSTMMFWSETLVYSNERNALIALQ